MYDKGDHRVAMHRLASERRKSGLPVWAYRWPIKDLIGEDDSPTAAATAAGALAARLKGHAGVMLDVNSPDYDEELDEIVWRFGDLFKELAEPMCDIAAEFNYTLDELYDLGRSQAGLARALGFQIYEKRLSGWWEEDNSACLWRKCR